MYFCLYETHMKVEKILELIEKLHWDTPQKVQEQAMKELTHMDDKYIYLLIFPNIGSDCWANAALVLKKIAYPRIKLVIPYLLEWLEDMNWPGALTIFELLLTVETKVLIPHIELLVSMSPNYYIEDNYGLERFIGKKNLKRDDFIQKDLYDKMKRLFSVV